MAKDDIDLREEIIRLGPWHHEIDVTPEVSTRIALKEPAPRSRDGFLSVLNTIYPDGLRGRSVLDCACNAGGYLFWAKEVGAGQCFGSDVREHWINQARFVAEHRAWPTDDMRFEVHDLYDLPKLGLKPFEVTVFSGIFYHLPDPVTGLKIAADLTEELMIFSTAAQPGHPDGHLVMSNEDTDAALSGVYGLNWFPTGPDVIRRVLRWAGFVETQLLVWLHEASVTPGLGQIGLIASKTPGLLKRSNGATARRFFKELSAAGPSEAPHIVHMYCKPGVELPTSERQLDVEATREAENKVLARVREIQRGGDVVMRWVFTFDDGVISRIDTYSDPAEAHAALAVEP